MYLKARSEGGWSSILRNRCEYDAIVVRFLALTVVHMMLPFRHSCTQQLSIESVSHAVRMHTLDH
jgi:hypothetical protein